uniref:Uncharacterized protein n=1 Tax=Meloidogyne enterolobii TaxID=390850 RepID=A0A6V7XK33_MELEN|nr:unnamed protein product [Meloidogyne enterolobii]
MKDEIYFSVYKITTVPLTRVFAFACLRFSFLRFIKEVSGCFFIICRALKLAALN